MFTKEPALSSSIAATASRSEGASWSRAWHTSATRGDAVQIDLQDGRRARRLDQVEGHRDTPFLMGAGSRFSGNRPALPGRGAILGQEA